MGFSKGQIVNHKFTGEKLLVLKHGREQIQCRTADYREIYFYKSELEAIN